LIDIKASAFIQEASLFPRSASTCIYTYIGMFFTIPFRFLSCKMAFRLLDDRLLWMHVCMLPSIRLSSYSASGVFLECVVEDGGVRFCL